MSLEIIADKARSEKEYYTSLHGVMVLLAGVAVLLSIGVGLIWYYGLSEKSRAMREWQVNLGLVAESRAQEVSAWLADQRKTVDELASNVSLQLYLSDLVQTKNEEDIPQEPAQLQYLRTLLEVTAVRGGFHLQRQMPQVRANIPYKKVSGIVILDMEGRPIVQTRDTPPLEGPLKDFVFQTPLAQKGFQDAFLQEGVPTIAFLAPIFRVQGEPTPEDQIGYVLGVRVLDESFYNRLKQPGISYDMAETLLVRKHGGLIEYLTALKNGRGPLTMQLDAATPDSSEIFAFTEPGAFGKKTDYRNITVLTTGRSVEGAPWVVVHQVEAREALSESRGRSRNWMLVLLLCTFLFIAVLIAVWRHASSLRAEAAAKEYRALARKHGAQEKLLRLIADTQPALMAIMNPQGEYRFANRSLAQSLEVVPEAMIGRKVQTMIGQEDARRYLASNAQALTQQRPVTLTYRRQTENGELVLLTKHIPLSHIPDPEKDELVPGVLVVEQDISEAIHERERRERTLENLVQSLMLVMDSRDLNAKNHSLRVSRLAKIIAIEMGLEKEMVDTVRFAGKLMNVGKILVPIELLTKQERLSDEERNTITRAMQVSADMLTSIEFDGPVAEAIRQSQENWDGTGPLGLKGEEIIVPARIIATANAFVAMVSPRSYRDRLSIEQAIQELIRYIHVRYDRAVVIALTHWLEVHKNTKDIAWISAA